MKHQPHISDTRWVIKYAFAASLSFVFAIAGCTSAPTIQKTTPKATEVVAKNELHIIAGKLQAMAGLCQSLYGEGSITLRDGSSSQSGNFELRSKRCKIPGEDDSLSMIVSGPFGITAAKFVGTQNEFHFINVLENERYNGKPDEKTLQKLTGMRGISLGLLNDLIYGISPIRLTEEASAGAIEQILESGKHRLVVKNEHNNITEAVTYKVINDEPRLYSYERWNKQLDSAQLGLYSADLLVTFSGIIENRPYTLPNIIKASSGSQSLEIEYTLAKENNSGVVKVKMPK